MAGYVSRFSSSRLSGQTPSLDWEFPTSDTSLNSTPRPRYVPRSLPVSMVFVRYTVQFGTGTYWEDRYSHRRHTSSARLHATNSWGTARWSAVCALRVRDVCASAMCEYEVAWRRWRHKLSPEITDSRQRRHGLSRRMLYPTGCCKPGQFLPRHIGASEMAVANCLRKDPLPTQSLFRRSPAILSACSTKDIVCIGLLHP